MVHVKISAQTKDARERGGDLEGADVPKKLNKGGSWEKELGLDGCISLGQYN